MSAGEVKIHARKVFALNFRNYLRGTYGFQEWFENHKELETIFGPEPWPGLSDFSV